jgi:phi13 family phage major tail protein
MANKVVFGLENVHIALLTESTGVYAAPVAIPGSVNLALNPEGDESTFYADNIAYYTATQNNGYKGDLEMALIPDAVLADILGWEVDANGALVEIADALPVPFALLFEVAGNEANKRYAFYKCTASRSKEEHKTKADKVDISTATLTLTITPIEIDDVLVVKAAIERTVANASVFDAWFTAVTEPSYAVS